jgi:hypothetical protein
MRRRHEAWAQYNEKYRNEHPDYDAKSNARRRRKVGTLDMGASSRVTDPDNAEQRKREYGAIRSGRRQSRSGGTGKDAPRKTIDMARTRRFGTGLWHGTIEDFFDFDPIAYMNAVEPRLPKQWESKEDYVSLRKKAEATDEHKDDWDREHIRYPYFKGEVSLGIFEAGKKIKPRDPLYKMKRQQK